MSSKNRGSIPQENDYYPTPVSAITPLLDRIDFNRVLTFLEPCCGDNRILNLIPADKIKFWTEISKGRNYFDYKFEDVDLIITNPPFSTAIEFLTKSLSEGKTVYYLQRLNWLGSDKRKSFWNSNPPEKIFVLSKRPQFKRELGLGGGTDSTEYAWFIWDKLNIVYGNSIEVL